jgi:RHS repeat-associated protein
VANLLHATPVSRLNFTNKYVYDHAGDWLWKTNIAGAVTTTTGYSYNANDQLVKETNAAGSFTNKYDANGSVTNRSSANETNLYAYNLEGRLATATIRRTEGGTPVVQTNKYFYSQSGIRTRAEMTGSVNQTNIFRNDPQNLTGFSQVLEELPAIGATPTASYTIGSQLISQKKSGTNLYFMADGHGSTRFLTDTNCTISDRYSYDAYGVALDFTFETLNPPRTAMLYSSERFDSDLQQYYLRARYYYPTVGRFGAQDQVDGTPNDPLSLHKYAYCQNDPINRHDPSGNEGDLISVSFAMSIGTTLQSLYDKTIAKVGDMLQTSAEASAEAVGHIEDDAANSDTATIIIHSVEGVDIHGGHQYGWSKPFQDRLTGKAGEGVNENISAPPLQQDFYEFNWGGFSTDMSGFLVVGVIPVKSVHQFAFINLTIAQLTIWMKGYNNMDVISHSWGTCLAYDMLNSGGIEMHDWVTMGSPLNHGISKPIWNEGLWINAFSTRDPVVYLNMYPNGLINWSPVSVPQFAKEPFNPSQVDPPAIITTSGSGGPSLPEHTAYWTNPGLLTSLRNRLQ